MQAHKVTLLIIDKDELGSEEIKNVIEYTRYPNRCIAPEVSSIETVEIGEWNDDHPLNQTLTADVEWHKIFPSLNAPTPCSDCKVLVFEGEEIMFYCSAHQPNK